MLCWDLLDMNGLQVNIHIITELSEKRKQSKFFFFCNKLVSIQYGSLEVKPYANLIYDINDVV